MSIPRPDLLLRRAAAAARARVVRDEAGAILVVTVLMMPVILVTMGLMLDGSLLYAARRQLQDAADAAALAGAMQVDLEWFEATGEWRIADQSNIQGEPTAHEAADQICTIYGVYCFTDVPPAPVPRTFHVVAKTTRDMLFIHIFTGQRTVNLETEATSVLVPGF